MEHYTYSSVTKSKDLNREKVANTKKKNGGRTDEKFNLNSVERSNTIEAEPEKPEIAKDS